MVIIALIIYCRLFLSLCDSTVWPEIMRIYLASDPKSSSTVKEYLEDNYPFSSIQNKLALLEYLCDEFLNTQNINKLDQELKDAKQQETTCFVCHKPDDLLCCETCSAVFHLRCLDPPLSHHHQQVPSGKWFCPICKLNTIKGVTDCEGAMLENFYRREPIGRDRHGRIYWFLSRRIIVEYHNSIDKAAYYSTRLQVDELMASLDAENYETELCIALEKIKEDVYRQMTTSEQLTESAK